MSDSLNPCVTCGACCAHFRVSFYWAEADDGRDELRQGEVVELVHTNRSHERIAKLVFYNLYGQVDGWTWDVNKSGFGVRLGPDTILYPDVLVDPLGRGEQRWAENPIAVLMVGSDEAKRRLADAHRMLPRGCPTGPRPMVRPLPESQGLVPQI